MSETQKKFYITTPIYYVNARPHIGHAYSTVIADVIARRHRLLGDDVFFLTGTDEHGQKIERSAAAAGIPPKEFADQVSETFRSLWKRMGITNDDFIRTTEPRHKQGVQKLFEALRDRGFIYLDTYTGQYCVSDEAYVEVGPGEPCPDCGRITETISESNYYFRLSAFQDKLIEKIESNELLIQPDSRRNEVLSFIRGNVVQSAGLTAIGDPGPLEQGLSGYEISNGLENGRLRRSQSGSLYAPGALKDLSVSRTSFKWGIPVPGDEGHVIYVWLDALANYITAVGYPDLNDERWKYWPANIHLVGKEIIRFHSVYWPAFLMAADLPLPRAIVANGWLLFEESKMSKSRGNVVRTETILDAFGSLEPELSKAEQDLFATDVLRYFLLREVPFGQDGGFSFDALWGRYNSELVNGYGNLVSRALSLIHQTQEGVVPDHAEWANVVIQVLDRKLPLGGFAGHPTDFGEFLRTPDVELARVATIAIHFQDRAFPAMRFSTGADFDPLSSSLKIPPVEGQIQVKDSNFGVLDYVALLVGKTDELFSSTKPWKLAKQDYDASRAELREVLYTAAEAIRITTALLYPILPYATAQVWSQLGLGSIEEAAKNGELKDLKWGGLKPGTKLGPLSPIFPRAPKELIQIMADTESANAPNGVPPAAPPSSPNKSSLILEENPTAAESHHPTDPAAGPRTASLPSEGSGGHVAASAAITTERHGTPPHGEAAASGVFANSALGSATPDTPQIAIDDFVKIDLRVAQIVVAERIPKADKLLRLEVDLGFEKRQILSGIAEWYTPEELVGRRIVVIANLAPRKMRGLESHGMLLAASNGENGKPVLATFGEEIALGSRLR